MVYSRAVHWPSGGYYDAIPGGRMAMILSRPESKNKVNRHSFYFAGMPVWLKGTGLQGAVYYWLRENNLQRAAIQKKSSLKQGILHR
jgi:hypothetical protein